TLSSSDGSILIDNRLRDLEDNLIEPPEYSSTIDLTLNTTTSTMFRAWIEVTELNKDGGTFDFSNTKITNDNSIVTINGVVLEGSQYSLDAGVVTISNLTEVELVVGDEIGVVSYTAEVPNSTFGNPTYGLSTSDISIVGEDPVGDTEPKAIVQNNLQTQQDVNWYLLREIENIEIPEIPDGIGGDQLVEKGVRLTIGFDDLPTDNLPDKGVTLIHGEFHRDVVKSLDVKSGDDGILDLPEYSDPSVLDVEHGVWVNGIREPTQYHSAARLYDVMTYHNRAVNWTNSKIEAIDIPDLEGYATEEWILDQSYITETVVTDAVDAQAQTQSTIDGSQDTKIETLENKVTALEGTVVEAQYKADTRDDPQIGSFVLKNMLDEKVLQFSQAVYIILSQTDFTNKLVDASKILNGDTIRLVMSPSNYANYTVTGVSSRNGNIALEVTFMSAGPEGIVLDGFVYDFNHATPFDVGAACTKQYAEDQDEVTLNAAKAYADSLEIPEVATNVMVTDGDQDVASGWKIISGGKTFISVGASQVGLYHVKDPTDAAHPVTLGYLEDGSKTIQISGSTSADAKIYFGSEDASSPQYEQKNLLSGCYKSNGGSRSYWSYGFNQVSDYWNYDWSMGSNLKMRWLMGDQNKEVLSISKNGVDMPSAYIVGDYSLEGVEEDQVEAVKEKAREIDIGHRLRELKNILVNLKTALKTKSADAQQALLDVLENVEDI
ncbi:MAG: hypothetical protein ACR2NI_11720, partial [Pirellulales bacterium]